MNPTIKSRIAEILVILITICILVLTCTGLIELIRWIVSNAAQHPVKVIVSISTGILILSLLGFSLLFWSDRDQEDEEEELD